MKKTILSAFCLLFSIVIYSQIIADHTVVDRYDDIPQEYIDKVKRMWLSYAGESHSYAVRAGLNYLEAIDSKYQVTTL
ncbi:MAG: hypothetical protein GX646_13350, partial [Bacteroidales bacterium]|nr:hypothetical protein [Bacteroidales bacterium]